MRDGGTSKASRNTRTATAGSIGSLCGSNPARFTYSWPSGNRSWFCRAQYSASVVLPIPAEPSIADTTTIPAPTDSSSAPVSAASSACLPRSEEHTSELQSRRDLVCRLLLEKKKKKKKTNIRLKKKKKQKQKKKKKNKI